MLQALGGFDRRFLRSQDYHLAIRAMLAYSFASVAGGPTFLSAHHHHERGAASARFSADQQRRKWLKLDQWIYFDLIAELPDAHFEKPGAPALHRTPIALTNRARAAATKLLLDQTIDALLTRVVRCSEAMPSAHEQGLIAAIPTLDQWYGVGVLAEERRFWRDVQQLSRLNAAGAAIAALLCRSKQWRARYGLSVMVKEY